MKKQVKKFFQFLEKEEGKQVSLKTKLLWQDVFTITNDDLNFKGNLLLNNAPISSLPDGLHIEGILHLGNSELSKLPKGLKVDGSLSLRGTPLANRYTEDEIRAMIVASGGYVGKNIFI